MVFAVSEKDEEGITLVSWKMKVEGIEAYLRFGISIIDVMMEMEDSNIKEIVIKRIENP